MAFTLCQAFIAHPLPTLGHSIKSHQTTPLPPKRSLTAKMSTARRSRISTTTKLQSTADDSPFDNIMPTPRVRVVIDVPARNKRNITASNLISAPIEVVWDLLSDYENLAEYIPNLVKSEMRPHPRKQGIRVEQCGAQSILGFQFRASLVMDMTEVSPSSPDTRAINFDLVTSRDFQEFSGTWLMKSIDRNKTALYYSVTIVPKGLVPVKAIEWRISEDVPQNMDAVRVECENRRRSQVLADRRMLQSRSELQ